MPITLEPNPKQSPHSSPNPRRKGPGTGLDRTTAKEGNPGAP
ncbi:hypothetical protein [Mycobacteroides salmoniphilum]|nr:hypothetical protein [Mycobacteroides salmoniphilum]